MIRMGWEPQRLDKLDKQSETIEKKIDSLFDDKKNASAEDTAPC